MEGFQIIIRDISATKYFSAEADKFETEAKVWVRYVTSIYHSKNITPHIHLMANLYTSMPN